MRLGADRHRELRVPWVERRPGPGRRGRVRRGRGGTAVRVDDGTGARVPKGDMESERELGVDTRPAGHRGEIPGEDPAGDGRVGVLTAVDAGVLPSNESNWIDPGSVSVSWRPVITWPGAMSAAIVYWRG